MFKSFLFKLVAAGLVGLTLVGCKSDAERAEEFFQSGMELLESGDVDRAIVQFRNVFEFAPNHRETLRTLAAVRLDQENPVAAYQQFLRISEQYPDDYDARLNLAELAFSLGSWPEFERHGSAVVEMRPDETRVQIIGLGLQYREAILGDDGPAIDALTTQAETLLSEAPQSVILNSLLVQSYGQDGRIADALERIDVLLSVTPDELPLHMQRLQLVVQLQDDEGIEAQLREMVTRFPENEEVQGMLLRFYVSQQRLDDAEGFLRELSDPADEDPEMFLALVRFISQVRGEDAARVELERAAAVNPRPARFLGILAMMDFQAGDQQGGIAQMEQILDGADVAQEDIQLIKTNLARMLVTTGNQVGARRQVEEVLTQNPSNVEALKIQAAWQIQSDQVEEALVNLRAALDLAPEDIQVMNLLYEAHQRLGDANLAREYLALAVEVSGNAPETSLRYARLLIQEERYRPAEDVLLPALRQEPQNLELLGMLGELYLRMEDIPRATQVIDTLNRIDSDQFRRMANALQTQLLARQSGTEEAVAFLEGLAAAEGSSEFDRLTLMRARLQVGETEQALSIAQELLAENPDDLMLKQAFAVTLGANGDVAESRALLREVVDAEPGATNAWVQLIGAARRMGEDESTVLALLDEGIEATDRSAQLLWIRATLLERSGDIDGAIGIYEELYERDSSSVIFANNLASLLATYKDDAESLERAWTVGRRLRNIDNPLLQDTYGWLLYRRGDFEEAVSYLEKAAAALEDPIVVAHLGFAYAAVERNDEALEQLQRAVDLAGPADTRARIEAARSEIVRLQTPQEN